MLLTSPAKATIKSSNSGRFLIHLTCVMKLLRSCILSFVDSAWLLDYVSPSVVSRVWLAIPHSCILNTFFALQDILLPAELNWLSTVDNAPIMAASMLTNIIASVKLPDMIQLAIDEKCGHFVNSVGACERLQKQPIPVAYTRYALSAWLLFLP